MSVTRQWMVGLALAMLLGLTGCQNNRLKTEHDALYRQNQELQAELDRTRAALENSETDKNNMAQELSRLQNQAAAPAAAAAPIPAMAGGPTGNDTGFGGIAGVETVRHADSITVRVPGDVLFESGMVDLKTTAKKTLAEIAAVIRKQYPNQTIRVEGYTDSDPIRRSKWTDNLDLSMERAGSVYRELAKQGISAKRMYAAGFGEQRPRETKAKSRRVEIVVVLHS